MDQIKIGNFIQEKRKEQKLTQSDLAEKLNITDRAVSNGKMVIVYLMLEQCLSFVKY